jgi:hypothetical protein
MADPNALVVNPPTRPIPIVVVTGTASTTTKETSVKSGDTYTPSPGCRSIFVEGVDSDGFSITTKGKVKITEYCQE